MLQQGAAGKGRGAVGYVGWDCFLLAKLGCSSAFQVSWLLAGGPWGGRGTVGVPADARMQLFFTKMDIYEIRQEIASQHYSNGFAQP